MKDTTILDGIITGRVDPQIYAFFTETVPNYLKVGDTFRPLSVRYNEWRKYFPNLVPVCEYSARIDEDTIFRDYSVHYYLLNERHRERLLPINAKGHYYSNEFFKDATKEDVFFAVEDIKKSADTHNGKYQFYSSNRLPIIRHYERNQTYEPRDNQRQVIENFKRAIASGRKNLLMYAVMRFGKSFTSLCCAKEIDAKIVLIVSAKADVMKEWKRTAEGHVYFSEYIFADKNDLIRTTNLISITLAAGRKIIVFLTLQDLQGEEIKARHAEVFSNEIDLLLIDETHFGARAEEYGKVLKNTDIKTSQVRNEMLAYDINDSFDEQVKTINSKYRIHLSGTPYRILMGDEFDKEDIIAFCQFADIVGEQKKWDEDYFGKQEINKDNHSEIKEWDNPYFGFPQMIRFAFNPSTQAKAKLEKLKASGKTYAFSALFKAKSLVPRSDNSHKIFECEDEILELFKVIDGVEEDENILSFLDYSKIKDGQMCHHIVCVLPFRTSCDALESLLSKYSHVFKNLNQYKVLNIAGYEARYSDIDILKAEMANSESLGQKTISLTVNKFLTGSTVEYWDTMLYFKDTSSPQEYDQAVFRLQSPYIKSLRNGNDTIRFNMKPQTLLVDFDPDRMFRLQELKSLFYNTNSEQRGNDELRQRVAIELAISPIIVINKDKLQQITPQNIIDAVRKYNTDKSILEEAIDIPFDKALLDVDDIKNLISALKPLKDKKGIELAPTEEDGTNFDVPTDSDSKNIDENQNRNTKIESEDTTDDLKKKLAAYYMRILFYAFLTRDKVNSLNQVIHSILGSRDNLRISQHVGLSVDMLQLIFDKASEFKLSSLDCTIENINTLGRDESLAAIERANVAMRKLSRISETEVVTPQHVSEDMISLIPDGAIQKSPVILDVASKQGELVYAVYRLYGSDGCKNMYSIATSKLTYELTRKIYESLDLETSHVLNFSSFELIGDRSDEFLNKIKELAPSIILAAPPYNKPDGGGRNGSGSGKAIYHYFYNAIQTIVPEYIVMFLKANWYSGGRGEGLVEFRHSILNDHHISVFHDYPDPEEYLDEDVALRGGVCMFLWDKNHDGPCEFHNHINKKDFCNNRDLKFNDEEILIRFNQGLGILSKILSFNQGYIVDGAYPRNPFKIESNDICMNKRKGMLKVYLPRGEKGYISTSKIRNYSEKIDAIQSWKVLVSKASPGEDTLPHAIIATPIVSEPGSLCSDSHLLVRVVDSKEQAENLAAYMKTRFFRFMMLLAKNDQNMTKDVFRYVPVLDLNKKWDDEMIYSHFNISKQEQEYIIELVTQPRA